MDEDRDTIRRVDWGEILSWLLLFRSFRLAIRFRSLLLSAAAVLLLVIGWMALAAAFQAKPAIKSQIGTYHGCPWLVPMGWVPDWIPSPDEATEGDLGPEVFGMDSPGDAGPSALEGAGEADVLSRRRLDGADEPFLGSWVHLTQPVYRLFGWEADFVTALFFFLCGVWAMAVWAFFAGAITRSTAVELAAGDRISWGETLRFAGSKWLANFAAPLLPLLGVFFCAAGVMFFAWLINWPATTWLAALLWPLLLISGLLMALLLLGLLFGWPLMLPTIGTEGTDSFDAISRSYAYTFQRPLHYLFYVLVVAAVGALSWFLVSGVAAGIQYFTYWASSWVAGGPRVEQIVTGGIEGSTLDAVGAHLIGFFGGCVKLLAAGFLYSYFWTAATAIYFLLRRDVDATELDEVFQEEQGEETYGLPAVEKDEAQAPVVSEPSEEPAQAEEPATEAAPTTEEPAAEEPAAEEPAAEEPAAEEPAAEEPAEDASSGEAPEEKTGE